MNKFKKAVLAGFGVGIIFALSFLLAQVMTSLTTLAQRPTAQPGGTLWCGTDTIWCARYSGAAWQGFGPIFHMYEPPLTSWSNDNGGTFDTTNGYPYFSVDKKGATAIAMEYRTAPATPYTCWALILHDLSGAPPGTSGTGNTAGVGIGFRQSTTGKIISLLTQGIAANPGIAITKWTNSATDVANYAGYNPAVVGGDSLEFVFRNPIWLGMTDNGTNLIYYWSLDGPNHPKQFDSRARGDFMTVSGGVTGPDQVGIINYANGNAVEAAVPSWACQATFP